MSINKLHYFAGEPECVFCGSFGPTEENEPCASREQIGDQVAFLQDKLFRVKQLAADLNLDQRIVDILERPFGKEVLYTQVKL